MRSFALPRQGVTLDQPRDSLRLLVEHVREEQRKLPELASVPVVLITADGRAPEKEKELGTAGYLQKPSLERLHAEVARVLSSAE